MEHAARLLMQVPQYLLDRPGLLAGGALLSATAAAALLLAARRGN